MAVEMDPKASAINEYGKLMLNHKVPAQSPLSSPAHRFDAHPVRFLLYAFRPPISFLFSSKKRAAILRS